MGIHSSPLERRIHLHDSCNRRDSTKNDCQDKHGKRYYECSPLSSLTPIVPPLLKSMGSCEIIFPLDLSQPLTIEWIAADLVLLVLCYCLIQTQRCFNVYPLSLADPPHALRCLPIFDGKEEMNGSIGLIQKPIWV